MKAPKAAPEIDIDFDLKEYRKLANAADDVLVGKVTGTRTSRKRAPARTVTDLEVETTSADGRKRTVLLRPDKKQIAEILKHKGEEHLFFWRTIAPGMDDRAKGVLGFFPFDAKHKKVLIWLKGGARQHTLFAPKTANVLPKGLEASIRVVRRKEWRRVLVRLTNRGRKTVILARKKQEDYPPFTDTRVMRSDGAVAWPGWQDIITNDMPMPPDYVAVEPGKSLDMLALTFAKPGEKLRSAPFDLRWLAPGTYHFRFVYDSGSCRAHGGREPLKARMIIYGSFEVKP